MFYKIIEDCSPYYVKFTYDGLEDLTNFVKTIPVNLDEGRQFDSYIQYFFPFDIAQEIINRIPLSKDFRFKRNWAPLMIMHPGKFMYPHKDSPEELCSFNLPITIEDDKCIVSWYDDSEFADCKIVFNTSTNPGKIYSRRVLPEHCDRKPRNPIKQLKLKLGEYVLINTNIFHSVDNTGSENTRTILALRIINDTDNLVTFEDAKSVLFKN
jgi:hypothetical protein